MITLISPAKTLDLSVTELEVSTEPEFKKEIKELVGIMKKRSKAEIQKLMGVSENIATLNKERYKNFEAHFTPENSKPALFTFKGDVYRKMDVDNYSKDQLAFAQEHLCILSGLYGLLKPLDLIQPYRLEMGIKLKNKKAKDLYGYWGNKIAQAIDAAAKDGIVINLASQEYFKAVNQK
ncbi:MAG: peroxide stress protein YaaA, partial [Anditalea sp.]